MASPAPEQPKSPSSGTGLTLGRLTAAAAVLLYGRSALNAKPVASDFTYSALVRHNHLLMGVGLLGCIGSVQAARRTEDPAQKGAWMGLHKSGGVLMLLALVVRVLARMRSTIPPRFPGPADVQLAEVRYRCRLALRNDHDVLLHTALVFDPA